MGFFGNAVDTAVYLGWLRSASKASEERAKKQYRAEMKEWYVSVGDTVTKGQKMGVAEALKRFDGLPDIQVINASHDGVVTWLQPLGESFGWTGSLAGIEPIPAPAEPTPAPDDLAGNLAPAVTAEDADRMLVAAVDKLAAAAEKMAQVADEVAAAKARVAELQNGGKTSEASRPNPDST